jgi:predicted nuclease with TOPRIM domain
MPDDMFWKPFFEFVSREIQSAADGRGKLDEVIDRLKDLKTKMEALMAAAKDINDLLNRIDTATTQIGERIRKLAEQLVGGVSASESEGIRTRLLTEADTLESMGKDPENPVPPVGGP